MFRVRNSNQRMLLFLKDFRSVISRLFLQEEFFFFLFFLFLFFFQFFLTDFGDPVTLSVCFSIMNGERDVTDFSIDFITRNFANV